MSPPPSRYSLLESLGRGGMGEVFLAHDTQLGRKVAIKFLTEGLETDAKARQRLHREARAILCAAPSPVKKDLKSPYRILVLVLV